MKKYSDTMPLSLQPLGDGNYHYNYNITTEQVEYMNGETRTQYVCDTVFISGEPTIAKLVAAVIAESYTADDIALLTAQHQAAEQGIGEEPDGYVEYLTLVSETNEAAQQIINLFNQSND